MLNVTFHWGPGAPAHISETIGEDERLWRLTDVNGRVCFVVATDRIETAMELWLVIDGNCDDLATRSVERIEQMPNPRMYEMLSDHLGVGAPGGWA